MTILMTLKPIKSKIENNKPIHAAIIVRLKGDNFLHHFLVGNESPTGRSRFQ